MSIPAVYRKKCLKWILCETELSYSNKVYLQKCQQVNILPLSYRFKFNDMTLFHKIVYKLIPMSMPDYLTFYNGNSRLRSTHLDSLSFVTNIASTASSINNLNKSFFFRSHTIWNYIPFEIRNISSPVEFRKKLILHFWSEILLIVNQSDYEEDWSLLSFQEND